MLSTDRIKWKIVIIILFIVFPSVCATSSVNEKASIIEWSITYGGTGNDVGRAIHRINGGYIVLGYTQSLGDGNSDVYLIKIDTNGSVIWNKTYGSLQSEMGYSIQAINEGGYIIAGTTHSIEHGFDVYLMKTDAGGNQVWNKSYGLDLKNIDCGYSVQVTSNGGYIIVGRTNSSRKDENDLYDVLLLKTDSEGGLIWNKTYGGDRSDSGRWVQETNDRGYIIAGETRSFSEDYDVFLLKVDTDGNEVWSRTIGERESDERGYSIQVTSDGGYVVTGLQWLLNRDNPDVYLLKTDSEGNLLWSKNCEGLDSRSQDWGYSVVETGEGGFIIVGETYSNVERNKDVILLKTDPVGKLMWIRTIGTSYNECGYAVSETGEGGYIITGYTSSGLEKDVYIAKTTPLPVNISIQSRISTETARTGEEVEISGKVDPPIAGVNIVLTYTHPDGSIFSRTIETDSEGAYMARQSVDIPGVWNILLTIEDGFYYITAESNRMSLTVKEASSSPLRIYISIVAVSVIGIWLLLRKRN